MANTVFKVEHGLEVLNNANVAGNLSVGGNLNVTGNLVSSGTAAGDFIPIDSSYSLGNTTNRWSLQANVVNVNGSTTVNGFSVSGNSTFSANVAPNANNVAFGNTSRRWDAYSNNLNSLTVNVSGNSSLGNVTSTNTTINGILIVKPGSSNTVVITDNNVNVTATSTSFSGNVNFDSGVVFVDSVNNRAGFNNTTPDATVTITGTANVSANVTLGGWVRVGSQDIINSSGNWVGSAAGFQGVQGAQGRQGAQGVQGLVGAQGTQGFQGVQGAQGVQGIQGVQGAQGVQGHQGIVGAQGNQGVQGAIGAQGNQGVQGHQGVQGSLGAQGFQGVIGAQGNQGFQGHQGAQGSVGAQGAPNSGTITDDTSTNTTYFPTFATGTSGTFSPRVSSSKLTFNPSTGILTASEVSASSDIKYKTNVREIYDALETVLKMKGVMFDRLDSDKKDVIGFIAQDLQQIIPSLVSENEYGLSVSYPNITALLVEAIRDLNNKIDSIKK